MLLSLKCDESHELISSGFDKDLSGVERWSVRLHLIACKPCRSVGRKLRHLHKIALSRSDQPATLSAEARERIRQKIINEK
ncbi:zf-HC2 domain-containing protein [Thalassoglobus neptunius]